MRWTILRMVVDIDTPLLKQKWVSKTSNIFIEWFLLISKYFFDIYNITSSYLITCVKPETKLRFGYVPKFALSQFFSDQYSRKADIIAKSLTHKVILNWKTLFMDLLLSSGFGNWDRKNILATNFKSWFFLLLAIQAYRGDAKTLPRPFPSNTQSTRHHFRLS